MRTTSLRDDTLVIYTSDQGSRFGHGGLWGNTSWSFPFTVHEVNMEVPLMFSQPGRVPGGEVREEFINQVDVFRTMLDYLGLEELEIRNSGGRSFSSMQEGGEPEWDSTAFFEFVTVRVVRSGRWKYMKRFDTGEPHTRRSGTVEAGLFPRGLRAAHNQQLNCTRHYETGKRTRV